MTRVLVLGANGMLGSMVGRVLASRELIEVVATSRRGGTRQLAFDASSDSIASLISTTRCDWIVNCIGVLKSRIDEEDPTSVAEAIDVNAAFPNRLASAAADRRVIQIATDGVYSGTDAPYFEGRPHDEPGVYAMSKGLGEVHSPNVFNLRCSVIGPEPPSGTSFLAWALSQPAGTTISGYSDHWWNGITSLHFAKLCAALIEGKGLTIPSLLHVVPADVVTKAALLQMVLVAYGHAEVKVRETTSSHRVDRTLGTMHERENRSLWRAAGYPHPPSVSQMIDEMVSMD